MSTNKPYRSTFAALAVVMIFISISTVGLVSMWSILAVGLFNSIMFPTIFTLTLEGLGDLKAQASGLLCMAIVGGAIIPFLFGGLIDNFGFKTAFILTILCYGYILFYGRLKTRTKITSIHIETADVEDGVNDIGEN